MKIKGGEKNQLATAMDPCSKVELLTHHPRGGHGDVEASGMVFFLRQGAGTGTTISSRDRNRDGGGTEVGFEKRVLSPGALVMRGPPWPRQVGALPLVSLLRMFFVPSGVF